MRIYYSAKKARRLTENAKEKGYDRIFIQFNRSIPDLGLVKGNIVEADEYDAERASYIIYTGYGTIKIWGSTCKQIV